MTTEIASKPLVSRYGPDRVKGKNGRYVNVDGLSIQHHRRYCADGEQTTEDGRRFTTIVVKKVLLNGKWTTKF